MGGRQTATALTKMTWYGGGAFLFLALLLSVLSARPDDAPESILRQGFPGQAGLPEAPASLLDAAIEVEDAEAPDEEGDATPAPDEGGGEDAPSDSGDPGGS